ncbi:MAG: hypothetical protein KDI15_04405 [Thiothrix sp.]|nr:hypothetical protein [Thiothrix sp.]HPE61003.1 HlyU family transcriptional regulator [Thiolinea sp.]
MSLFSSLKALLGSADTPASQAAETYKDYEILTTPQREGSQYRVSGLIRKGEREHHFIRADLLGSAEECTRETLRKAKLTIDQLGDDLFRG